MRKSSLAPLCQRGEFETGMMREGEIPARDRRNDGEKDGCLIPTGGHDHVAEEDLRNSLRNVMKRKSPLALL